MSECIYDDYMGYYNEDGTPIEYEKKSLKMELTKEEIEYLKFLFEKYEFDIKTDIIHCEVGAETLMQKLQKIK